MIRFPKTLGTRRKKKKIDFIEVIILRWINFGLKGYSGKVMYLFTSKTFVSTSVKNGMGEKLYTSIKKILICHLLKGNVDLMYYNCHIKNIS